MSETALRGVVAVAHTRSSVNQYAEDTQGEHRGRCWCRKTHLCRHVLILVSPRKKIYAASIHSRSTHLSHQRTVCVAPSHALDSHCHLTMIDALCEYVCGSQSRNACRSVDAL